LIESCGHTREAGSFLAEEDERRSFAR
jgi:hypothetical protein